MAILKVRETGKAWVVLASFETGVWSVLMECGDVMDSKHARWADLVPGVNPREFWLTGADLPDDCLVFDLLGEATEALDMSTIPVALEYHVMRVHGEAV